MSSLTTALATLRLRTLQVLGLGFNSPMALGALTRMRVREGLDEDAASELVALQRARVRRRTITACFALIALGVLLNHSPRRSLAHTVAAVLIYGGLFVLASQFSRAWVLRPGTITKQLFRR
jgi:hypothetical protein